MIAWTIYLTFGGAVLLLLLPCAFARWVALFATIAGLALGIIVFVGTPIADLAHFTTIVRVPWVPALGMNYHLALDGVSLTMVLVTGISAVSTVLFSWDVEHRQNEFFFWLLLVVAGCYGVFLSADLFLLFVFYELVIVPKYFLIAIFGSTNKEYGAMKLTLYSFFGGMFVFVGILVAYVTGGSLDLNQLSQFEFSPQLQSWAFPLLFLGFAVLAGIWPLHTWAPTGHAAAPTAGSMLLAGIVMKLGSYAGLRVAMNLFPQGFQMWSKWIAVLAVIGIVYAANVLAWRYRGPLVRRRRTHDLPAHAHARTRCAFSNESESCNAFCGFHFRSRRGCLDGYPRFQWIRGRDHDSYWRMENLSDCRLDRGSWDSSRCSVHIARAKTIVLR
jgi:NADH-quinone oxidoreductase subunit M